MPISPPYAPQCMQDLPPLGSYAAAPSVKHRPRLHHFAPDSLVINPRKAKKQSKKRTADGSRPLGESGRAEGQGKGKGRKTKRESCCSWVPRRAPLPSKWDQDVSPGLELESADQVRSIVPLPSLIISALSTTTPSPLSQAATTTASIIIIVINNKVTSRRHRLRWHRRTGPGHLPPPLLRRQRRGRAPLAGRGGAAAL